MAQSNVIALNVPNQRQSLATRLALHAELFANRRRSEDDVFWLKENAEFLNIAECTGLPGDALLECFEPIFPTLSRRLGDFPQYYRFLLSICLDLEDLGMPGTTGEALCAWAKSQGLAEAELSDLQRAEADRLLARRSNHSPDADVTQRLMRFVNRSKTFGIPNKKAAYELTHIVFYLSEYGRKDPGLNAAALDSLHFAGLQAFLEQNFDLLAEICIALRYAGQEPSPIWERAVTAALFAVETDDPSIVPDDYHAYLVSTWLGTLIQQEPMPVRLNPQQNRLVMAKPIAQPLRELAHYVQEAHDPRWRTARDQIEARLDRNALRILRAGEQSSDRFEDFFEIYARAHAPV